MWDLLEQRVDETPDSLMFVDEDMRTLTFAEFWSEAELVAAGLAAAGVRAGDVVSWQLPNWIETNVLIAALARLEVVQHPVLPSVGTRQLESMLEAAGSTLLVVPADVEGHDVEADATAIARRLGNMRVLVADRALPQGDPTSLPALPDPIDAGLGTDPDADPAIASRWLFHTAGTTGTTGAPKLVRHSDAGLLAAARALHQRVALIPHDRHAQTRPAGHVEGVVWLFASLLSGCSNILSDRFDPEHTCEVFSREGATLVGASPARLRTFIDVQRRQLHPLFPDLRAFLCAGASPPSALLAEVMSLFDVPVLTSYGMTEAPVLAARSVSEHSPDDRSAGTPGPGVEIRLVRTDGTLAPLGVTGEIRVRAPQLSVGYVDPSPDTIDDDGFFRTGDLGHLDELGRLTVTGRLDDVIVRHAGVVSASQLEDLLHRHEKVADVAVIGLPDPDVGEQVCAVVQLQHGHEPLTIDEVVLHLRDQGLAVDGLPERLEIVEALPRTASGSVLRHVLRDEFKG